MTTAAQSVTDQAASLSDRAYGLADEIAHLTEKVARLTAENEALLSGGGHSGFLIIGFTIFILACFVGYYVVWRVTPALHSPLMGVTNAISSVIIVGAVVAAGAATTGFSGIMGFLAVMLASINIFGGFIITNRMLSMFKKKK
ncbi:MAG: hypothetical protein CMH30_06905 [Micavibrio sp.]|nr:hypothetical protein [Micavibrio sp.]|tara:strand:+ start:3509 stop:3937 length:429 start_codon:yes stop_codon:yes gene_type:complete